MLRHLVAGVPVVIPLALSSMALTPAARAQDVALSELTVNDESPPDRYRNLLESAISPTLVRIRDCYRQRLAQRPGLAGFLRLRLWVSARQVIRTTREESTIADSDLERCAVARIGEFRLPDAAPDGGARVRFVLRFTPPAGGPTPPPTAASTGMGSSATPGSVSPAASTVTVDAVRGPIADTILAANLATMSFARCRAPRGTIQVRLTIARNGSVRARAAGGSIRDRTVQRCVVDVIQSHLWGEEPAPTRATVTVSFP